VLLDRGLQEIALPRPLGPTSQLACITQEDASETVVDQEHRWSGTRPITDASGRTRKLASANDSPLPLHGRSRSDW